MKKYERKLLATYNNDHPMVVRIENEEQHRILSTICDQLTPYDPRYLYYLCGGGCAQKRSSYEYPNSEYAILDFEQIEGVIDSNYLIFN